VDRGAIEIYKLRDGQTYIEVKFDAETVWLNQKQISVLFGKDSDTIGLHLKNIFAEGEATAIFGNEKDEGFKSALQTIV